MNTATAPDPHLSQKSDADLLSEIGMAEDFPDDAEAAFREFHRRHMGYVYGRLRKWIDDSEMRTRTLDGEQLASTAFERAFHKAADYRDQSGGDAVLGNNQVRAWLFRIAMNLALSALRSPSAQLRKQMRDLPDENCLEDTEDASPPGVSPEMAALAERAMASLNEVDRDILYTCLAYRAFGEQADALPQEVRKELLAKHGLSEATFRQRKSRALKRLREFFSEHSANQ
jgi:DNA-directed RNA polymerase specialized sigma24 family protein